MSARAPRLLVALALALSSTAGIQVQAPPTFASRVAQLSEPGGYFDTDNLISNERSYLQVVPAMRARGLTGGAYIGVGPDQNFSYIAQARPNIAFIVDVRRDNLLLHLIFKALFSLSETRVDYLSQLFGRAVPAQLADWRRADLERIIAHVEGPRLAETAIAGLRARVDAKIAAFGLPLSGDDFATIDRFHRRFISAGLPLKFQTTGRQPQSYYPTYRDLLIETDHQKRRWNLFAAEDDFQFVRSLQQRDLVVPVVGDLAGRSALAAIGRLMTSRGDRLSAFYVSNVEFYLFREGTFPAFVENLKRLPHTSRSVIIRSVFGGLGQPAAGYHSASLVQPVDELLQGYGAGRFRGYTELTVSP